MLPPPAPSQIRDLVASSWVRGPSLDSTWTQTKMRVQKGGSSLIYSSTRFCFSIMLVSVTVIF